MREVSGVKVEWMPKVGDIVEVVNGRNYANDGDALTVRHIGKLGKVLRFSRSMQGGVILDIDEELFFIPRNLRPVAPKPKLRRWKCVDAHRTSVVKVGDIIEGEPVNGHIQRGFFLLDISRFVEVTDDISSPTTRPENVLENEPEFNTFSEQPYDMDAAFVQDRLTALKRMMPVLDVNGKPMQKEQKAPDRKMTAADVLMSSEKAVRKYCGL